MSVYVPLTPGGTLRRWAAFALDQLIVGSLWLLASIWALAFYLSVSRWPGDLRSLGALTGLLVALGVLLHGIYWIVFVGGCGQTPGKIALGLRVVRRDAGDVGYWRALWRWVGIALAALPFGLGFLGVVVTREKRGLHDWVAGTRVVQIPSVEGMPVTVSEPSSGE